MDIKQTASHLKQLGQPFDVIITKNGNVRELYANCEPTDVEGLLNEVVSTHNPDTLIIQERKRNGNANIKKEKYPITLGSLQAAPIQNTMHNQHVPAAFQDYLIKDLEKKNEKLEKKVDKLEGENEKLKTDNFELMKTNQFKDKEFELSKKESDMEKSNGLSGIMETVGSNPVLANLAATAIGRLMGIDVPPVGAIESDSGQMAGTGTTQEQIADHVRNWLKKLDEQTATQFFQMVNLLAQDVSQVNTVLTLLQGDDE